MARARCSYRSTSSIRLAGPEDEALCPIEPDEWEGDVDAMEESLDDGWEPPPLLAEHQGGRLLLQDGNHRYEALVRAGETHAWTLIWFDDPGDRRRVPPHHELRVHSLSQRNLSFTFSLPARAFALALSALPLALSFLLPVTSPATTLALPRAFCSELFAF